MSHLITFHPEKEYGYQWKLEVSDAWGKMTQCFKTKEDAEQYVIFSILEYGHIV